MGWVGCVDNHVGAMLAWVGWSCESILKAPVPATGRLMPRRVTGL